MKTHLLQFLRDPLFYLTTSVKCSYCQKVLRQAPFEKMASHGACGPCAVKCFAEFEEFKRAQLQQAA